MTPSVVERPKQRTRLAERKQTARDLLAERDLAGLARWADQDRDPLRTLQPLLFDHDPLIRWRAIEALGRVAAARFAREPQRVEDLLNRMLWLMNDESGGICWNAPEVIGEIVRQVPALADDYGRLLPSFFGMEPFEKGSRRAVARAAPADPTKFQHAIGALAASLKDPDPEIRGLSLLALDALAAQGRVIDRANLLDDNGELELYDFDTGELQRTTVGALARRALER